LTKKIKILVGDYFQQKRGCAVFYETSSIGGSIADITASKINHKDVSTIYEIEVKISRADFKNELKKKYPKHYHLANDDYETLPKWMGRFAPNYFYFAVPKYLSEFALKELEKFPAGGKYGMIILAENNKISIIKNCKRLNNCQMDKMRLYYLSRSMSFKQHKSQTEKYNIEYGENVHG